MCVKLQLKMKLQMKEATGAKQAKQTGRGGLRAARLKSSIRKQTTRRCDCDGDCACAARSLPFVVGTSLNADLREQVVEVDVSSDATAAATYQSASKAQSEA